MKTSPFSHNDPDNPTVSVRLVVMHEKVLTDGMVVRGIWDSGDRPPKDHGWDRVELFLDLEVTEPPLPYRQTGLLQATHQHLAYLFTGRAPFSGVMWNATDGYDPFSPHPSEDSSTTR